MRSALTTAQITLLALTLKGHSHALATKDSRVMVSRVSTSTSAPLGLIIVTRTLPALTLKEVSNAPVAQDSAETVSRVTTSTNASKKTLALDSPPAPTLMVVSNALAKMVSPEMGQLVLISMSVPKVPTTVVRMLHASTDLVDSAACATADSRETESRVLTSMNAPTAQITVARTPDVRTQRVASNVPALRGSSMITELALISMSAKTQLLAPLDLSV